MCGARYRTWVFLLLLRIMKTLYLVRHAKASRDIEGIQDWERPLTGPGIERARKVAGILKKKKVQPGRIISSHAFRALNTAVIFAHNLGYPASDIVIDRRVYERGYSDLLALIKKQDDSCASLMLFGHNPILSELNNYLITTELEELSTSQVSVISFPVNSWKKIGKGTGKIEYTETGK